MILAADIGNTTTHLGLFDPGPGLEVRRHLRLPTGPSPDRDELKVFLQGSRVEGVIISSVVPEATGGVRSSLGALTGVTPVTVGVEVLPSMPLLVDNPALVGVDRVVNGVAAFELYGGPVIVVDFGTAITFDYITGHGEFKGGVIAPGISTSAAALSERAAMLPKVELKRPARVVGADTASAMRSGVYWGFAALVDGIIERMKGEVGGQVKVVATGGAASLIAGASSSVKEVDELLTLKGLKILGER